MLSPKLRNLFFLNVEFSKIISSVLTHIRFVSFTELQEDRNSPVLVTPGPLRIRTAPSNNRYSTLFKNLMSDCKKLKAVVTTINHMNYWWVILLIRGRCNESGIYLNSFLRQSQDLFVAYNHISLWRQCAKCSHIFLGVCSITEITGDGKFQQSLPTILWVLLQEWLNILRAEEFITHALQGCACNIKYIPKGKRQ